MGSFALTCPPLSLWPIQKHEFLESLKDLEQVAQIGPSVLWLPGYHRFPTLSVELFLIFTSRHQANSRLMGTKQALEAIASRLEAIAIRFLEVCFYT